MSKALSNRIFAAFIDYCIIAAYVILLFLGTEFLSSLFHWKLNVNPYTGQAIGFITLTVPVIVYSYLMEKSTWRGTVGKILQKLTVKANDSKRKSSILLRNLLKYLPWELAHTGVHWTIYYSSKSETTPPWVWLFLILPQIIVVLYFISIARSKGDSSIYDKISNTGVVLSPILKKEQKKIHIGERQ